MTVKDFSRLKYGCSQQAVSRDTHFRHGHGHIRMQILILFQGYELGAFSNKIEDRLIHPLDHSVGYHGNEIDNIDSSSSISWEGRER